MSLLPSTTPPAPPPISACTRLLDRSWPVGAEEGEEEGEEESEEEYGEGGLPSYSQTLDCPALHTDGMRLRYTASVLESITCLANQTHSD